MKKNVLASNPLDMMFTPRARPEPVEQQPQTGTATSPVVVSIDAHTSRAAQPPHSEPIAEPAHEVLVSVPVAVPSETQTAERPESLAGGAGINRIGTLHKPYVRQKDGVRTRQASVTLPVDMLRKVGHCAVDTSMKTSEIIQAALEEYLQRRGY